MCCCTFGPRDVRPQGTATNVVLCCWAWATILGLFALCCSGAVGGQCFDRCACFASQAAFFAYFSFTECSCMHLWHAALSNVPVHSSEQLRLVSHCPLCYVFTLFGWSDWFVSACTTYRVFCCVLLSWNDACCECQVQDPSTAHYATETDHLLLQLPHFANELDTLMQCDSTSELVPLCLHFNIWSWLALEWFTINAQCMFYQFCETAWSFWNCNFKAWQFVVLCVCARGVLYSGTT